MTEAPAPGFADDPSERIVEVFRNVARTRMADVPILNPRLRVEAVGFGPWNDQWLGVLVTPWCMNLVLLPVVGRPWVTLRPGEKRIERFPAGDFEFVCGEDERLGEYHACSLFSPVLEFEDEEAARLTALAARRALFDPKLEEVVQRDGKPVAGASAPPVTRRAFLLGPTAR